MVQDYVLVFLFVLFYLHSVALLFNFNNDRLFTAKVLFQRLYLRHIFDQLRAEISVDLLQLTVLVNHHLCSVICACDLIHQHLFDLLLLFILSHLLLHETIVLNLWRVLGLLCYHELLEKTWILLFQHLHAIRHINEVGLHGVEFLTLSFQQGLQHLDLLDVVLQFDLRGLVEFADLIVLLDLGLEFILRHLEGFRQFFEVELELLFVDSHLVDGLVESFLKSLDCFMISCLVSCFFEEVLIVVF